MDTIDLLYYGLDILAGKEKNDLDKQDLHKMKHMLDRLICKYLQEDDRDNVVVLTKIYCEVCRCKTLHRIIHKEGDRICECEMCNNMEVI